MTAQENGFEGWVPSGVRSGAGGTMVNWCWLGSERLTDPFFDQTLDRIRARENRRKLDRTTPVDALFSLQRSSPGLNPAALIFHMSRTGSTLVTRMLSAVPRFVAISEPAVVESVLRGPARSDQAATIALLRALISALSRPREATEAAFFLKLSSRSAADMHLFRLAFPDVPRVVLYREPSEVLSSLLRGSRGVLPPGLREAGLLDTSSLGGDVRPVEFWARVLARFCTDVVNDYDPRTTLLVHYAGLPAAVWSRIVPFASQTCSDGDRELMLQASRFDAKAPSKVFKPDRHVHVTDEMLEAVERFVRRPYESLESLRRAAGGP